MTPFLLQIAEAYVSERRDTLMNYCFVFPNKRACTFFSKYLLQTAGADIIFPAITDIDSLVMDLTGSIVPSRTEQILILFNCYRELVREAGGDDSVLSLETFIPWGEMVLNDFNDVDHYLADPADIFRNLKHFKEISANFLSEEQVKIIQEYWGGDPVPLWNDSRLWQHLDYEDKNKDTVRNFYRLWFLMYPLYTRFNATLDAKGKTYNGAAYRRLAAALKTGNPFDNARFRNVSFVFIGFNQLSTSQEKLFSYLKNKKLAAFYWDDASAAFSYDINPCVNAVRKYKRMFPADETLSYDFTGHIPGSLPEIEIIGVPSHYGEVKSGAQILRNLLDRYPGEFEGERTRRTAFVLPEEIMVLPLLDSLPQYKNPDLPPEKLESEENLLKVNITMAYPMKSSPFASLFRLTLRMYEHARLQDGELHFYYKDVIALLSHPTIRSAHPDFCLATVTAINNDRRFEVSRGWLANQSKELAALFPGNENPLEESSFDQVRSMLLTMRDISPEDSVESAFATSYLRGLDTLERLYDEYGIIADRLTILNQLHKVASTDAVHFSGEPLEGVQIMGMLETRAIDFDNIIILGVNERIFPRRQAMRSFIPMTLRKGYGLPVAEDADAVHAYYFYRLIGRAKRVFLIYDSRKSSGGEMSRYIYQLQYLYSRIPGTKITRHEDFYILNAASGNTLSVSKKVPWIQRELNKLRQPESGEYLSASTLEDYMVCPMRFFLTKIAKYNISDDLKDFIEDSNYGTIIHSVMERLYNMESTGTRWFTPESINTIRATKKGFINREIVRAIRISIYGVPKKEAEALPDSLLTVESLKTEHALIATIIAEVIDNTLAAEAEFREIESFRYIGGEFPIKHNIPVKPELSINFKGYIDRIDEVKLPGTPEPVLRFIDYKTGNESVTVPSEASLFDTSDKKWAKGVFQLMLYCIAYSEIKKTQQKIIPQIFPIRNLKKEKLTFCKTKVNETDKKYSPLTDYRVFQGFRDKLGDMLSELFNEEIPFENRPGKSACKFCKFKPLCNV